MQYRVDAHNVRYFRINVQNIYASQIRFRDDELVWYFQCSVIELSKLSCFLSSVKRKPRYRTNEAKAND